MRVFRAQIYRLMKIPIGSASLASSRSNPSWMSSSLSTRWRASTEVVIVSSSTIVSRASCSGGCFWSSSMSSAFVILLLSPSVSLPFPERKGLRLVQAKLFTGIFFGLRWVYRRTLKRSSGEMLACLQALRYLLRACERRFWRLGSQAP